MALRSWTGIEQKPEKIELLVAPTRHLRFRGTTGPRLGSFTLATQSSSCADEALPIVSCLDELLGPTAHESFRTYQSS